MVCRLNKALYGLYDAPLWWYDEVSGTLVDVYGWKRLTADPCLFVRGEQQLLLYVDDMLTSAPTIDDTEKIWNEIEKYYTLKRLGEARKFVGFEILHDRDRHRIFLHQRGYVEAILERYLNDKDIGKLNPVKTPYPTGVVIPADWKTNADASKAVVWRELTGSLGWPSLGTRPDITYTVQKLCEANCGPSPVHEKIMHHLMRYLSGSTDWGIYLGGLQDDGSISLVGFADTAFGDRLEDRRSTAGHVIFMGIGPIHWRSRKQSLVTSSTTETEFINLMPTGISLMWIAKILTEMGIKSMSRILLTDSENAMAMVLNPLNPARTRHIDIKYKWTAERVEAGDFTIAAVRTHDMAADGLTKPLKKNEHAQFVRLIKVGPPNH